MMAFQLPSHRLVFGSVLACLVGFGGMSSLAQQGQVPTPAPAPLPAPAPAPATPAPAIPEPPRNPAESAGGEMREIIPQPVLKLRSQGTWDDAHNALRKGVSQLLGEAQRLGLQREGNPMAHFIDSDDLGFTFEAMVPLASMPEPGKAFSEGVEATMSPGGRAVIFPYEGANDEIDNAYEALTAWLDDKGLVSTGRYLEEYEFLPEKGDDPGMKARIIIFLK